MNGRVGATRLAELPDVPRGEIERLVNFRGRNLRGGDAPLEREQAGGDFLGDFAVVHGRVGLVAEKLAAAVAGTRRMRPRTVSFVGLLCLSSFGMDTTNERAHDPTGAAK